MTRPTSSFTTEDMIAILTPDRVESIGETDSFLGLPETGPIDAALTEEFQANDHEPV